MIFKIVITRPLLDGDYTVINYIQADDIERLEISDFDTESERGKKVYVYFKAHGMSARMNDPGVPELIDWFEKQHMETSRRLSYDVNEIPFSREETS